MAQAPQLTSSRATLERLEKLKTDVNVFGEMRNLYLDMGKLSSTLYKQNLGRITRIEDSFKRLGGGLKKLTNKLGEWSGQIVSDLSLIETRIKKLEDRDAATAAQGLVQLQGNKRQRISGGRKKHKTKRVRKKHKKKTKKRRRKRKTKKRRR